MDECQLYSTLLEIKFPWKIDRVSIDSGKKTVEIYIAHEKGSKLLCPMCRKAAWSMITSKREYGGILTVLNS